MIEVNEGVDGRKIDNTIANRKRAKGQTTMYTILPTVVAKIKKNFFTVGYKDVKQLA